MRNGIELIAFDLDGVLVDGGGSWMQVHEALGTLEQSRLNGSEYFSGRINFGEWAKRDVALWNGVGIERMKEILYNTRLMDGIEETLPKLKERYRIAIISGGLKMLADHLAERFNLDYCFGNELIVKDGKVAGISHTVDFEGKGEILKRIAGDLGITTKQCAAVGDYLNDIPMFREAGYSIAFNPKDQKVVDNASQAVYEKDLRNILPYF